MRVGLLVDRMTVTRWQEEAIRRLGGGIELIVYNCTNPPPSPRRLRHYPYYLLNIVSLRGPLTRHTRLPGDIRISQRVDFKCKIKGNWQSLPQALVDRMNADELSAIIKFGLGLLKVPEQLSAPILSYHHGDPRKFRGRPAGFYELLAGESVLGQVVQILSNQLDSGRVAAYAETPVRRHSYRATMREAYTASPLLLRQALRCVANRETLDFQPSGRAYRLPSLVTVLRFVGQRLTAMLQKLAYGCFIEKQWQVAEAAAGSEKQLSLQQFPPMASWRSARPPQGFRFLADPFPNPCGAGILVEALRSSTGLGEILQIDADRARPLLSSAGHFSYPSTLVTSSGCYLLPEVCQWSLPKLFCLEKDGARPTGPLNMRRPARLVDPTLFDRDGTVYLFANDYSEGDFILRLWFARTIDGPFEEHPASPVCISPLGGRMGGLLFEENGLYRFGQDGSDGYGNGIFLFRVLQLSRTSYRETMIDQLRFSEVRGPHTVNFAGDRVLFDFYRHRFAPLAGLRRLRNRTASRSRS
jgi:hypothetical protein